MSDTARPVNGNQFIRRLRRLARRRGVEFRLDAKRGKGGHRTVYFGNRRTTVKSGEIGVGLLNAMCRQLGIERDDL